MQTIIQTPTPNLSTSLDFYRRLNFQILNDSQPTLVAEGNTIIEITPERTARAGVKLYQESWDKEVAALRKITTVSPIKNGYLLSDPSGMWIYLLNGQFKAPNPLATHKSDLGTCAGLSLESTAIHTAVSIWEALGFTKAMGDIEQGWVAYQNATGFGISLMQPMACPHLFFNPSLTYFNSGQNLAVIEKIRTAGIPITEEITAFNEQGIVDNVIIRDPGGFGFFVFND